MEEIIIGLEVVDMMGLESLKWGIAHLVNIGLYIVSIESITIGLFLL